MPKQKFKFKDAFERLEKIVSSLEGDDIDVEDAMKKYAEGLELVKLCKQNLEEVENKVKEIRSTYAE
ncbi:MAG: exodeoxyribonuclease VII small subunit [bacterium]|nr:exodeoxyribonuclease VII small subunit [bacterium]